MNPLLVRQLRKHLPALNTEAEAARAFLATVSAAYDEMQKDRTLLEHTLEVTSDELTAANEKLRLEAEDRLKSLSRYYQQTMELQQGMILCFVKTGRGFTHTLCHGQLAHQLGWLPAQVEGSILSDFLPPEQAGPLHAAYERAWAGEECEYEGKSAGGDLVYLAQLRPRREGGKVREVIVSCVEITALKTFEHELQAAKARAESADRAKSEFLSVMGHEIRTPLNAIVGFAQLLQDSPMSAEQKDWLASIETGGDMLRDMIEKILDFIKIETGKIELREQPVELARLLETITATFRPEARKKRIDFDLVSAPDLPGMILTDGNRLGQILGHLVGNAVKFTSRGGVTLSVAVAGSGETSAGPRPILRFEVGDTGIGIAAAHCEQMFKPFAQADSSVTRRHGGTGLGLAISKRLAVALGGDISYESEPGIGSHFMLILPVRSVGAPVLDKVPPKFPLSAKPDFPG